MKLRIAPLAALLVLALSASAQITPIGPFTADGIEGFESQPSQGGACIAPRVFGNRADMCALGTGTVGIASGFGGGGTIFSRSGAHCASTGSQDAAFTFDTPVSRFGGYFGLASGTAQFFDANGASLGTQTVTAVGCTLNCSWTWNGWDANGGPPFKRIEISGIIVDDLVALFGAGPTGVAYCNGDGSGTPCPCSNASNPLPHGCPHSAFGVARLLGSGTPSLAADSVVLATEGASTFAPALYFQGTSRQSGGAGIAFGDGLLCVAGSITRLGIVTSTDGGSSQFPPSGGPTVHAAGFISGPGVYTYQVWYRDSNTSFCTASTFNLTNGFEIAWGP